MVSVQYSDGSKKEFARISQSLEAELAIASYRDNVEEVQAILGESDTIDVNASVWHSPTRGNGTPLVLTGKKEIAGLLLDRGADVNRVYNNGNSKFTALDSALKELEKQPVLQSDEKLANTEALIEFLKSQGAKTYNEIQGEER